jgi:hypothetical protein
LKHLRRYRHGVAPFEILRKEAALAATFAPDQGGVLQAVTALSESDFVDAHKIALGARLLAL